MTLLLDAEIVFMMQSEYVDLEIIITLSQSQSMYTVELFIVCDYSLRASIVLMMHE